MSNVALIPLSEIAQMAKILGQNKLFGKTADENMALMLVAQAQGLHPAKGVLEYDLIQGRPAIKSNSALSRFQLSGGKIQWTKRTDVEASAIFRHPQGGECEIIWTMERAKQAQLTGKDNWKKFPAQMLAARVSAEGVRAVFPACLDGLYTVEEVQDFDDEKISPKLKSHHNNHDIISQKKEVKEVVIMEESVDASQAKKPKMNQRQIEQLVGKIKDNCQRLTDDPMFQFVEENHKLFENARKYFDISEEELAEIFASAEASFQVEIGG